MKNNAPTIVSGIMDLVFKEEDGWVILDYKTNAMESSKLGHSSLANTPGVLIFTLM